DTDTAYDYEYEYDAAGRVTLETQTLAGLTPTIVLDRDYDALGHLVQLTVTVGGTVDAVTDYFYDGFGRIESIQQHGAGGGNAVAEKRVDFSYDDAGQWAAITRYADTDGGAGNLVATGTYTYDDAGRLVGLTYTQGETELVEHQWFFDAAGRMTQYVNSIDGTVDYTHDDAGQLVEADYDYQGDEEYTYDDNGNRVTGNGQNYATWDNNQLISDGVYRYLYDYEGNRTVRYVDADTSGTFNSGDTDVTAYTWDYRNRLTSVGEFATYATWTAETPTQTVSYAYDHQNRLIRKTLDADGGGTIDASTVFVHDGGQIGLQFDKTGSGAASASDLAHRYLWGPAVDQLLADEQVDSLATPGDVVWPLVDHLNTTRDLAVYDDVNDETTIANHRTFDAFGNLKTVSPAATVDCLFAFTGRMLDEDTGLQNNLNRWYDPAVGRWLSEDPIGFDAGDANLYRYVGNGPLTGVDPSGQVPQAVAGCFAGSVVSGGTSFIINWWNGDSAGTAAKKAGCAALGGCIQGAAIATFPGPVGGCLGGVVATLAENACLAGAGLRGPLNACDALNLIVNAMVGCIGGLAAEADDANITLIAGLVGLDATILTSLCNPDPRCP
ncbi:MAG: hypothetical protein GX621_06220, partial [Pirellulaceae bacterium]|nr:hypothetical protein [Pirellulaceae bacterium]